MEYGSEVKLAENNSTFSLEVEIIEPIAVSGEK